MEQRRKAAEDALKFQRELQTQTETQVSEEYATWEEVQRHSLKSFADSAVEWVEMAKDPSYFALNSMEGRMGMEVELVTRMNKMFAILDGETGDSCILMMWQNREGLMNYVYKTKQQFLNMCASYRVPTVKRDDLEKHEMYFILGINSPEFSVPIKRNKDGVPEGMRAEMVSVGDIWLRHSQCRHINRLVFNPRPSHWKNAALPNELNIWVGYKYRRQDVVQYKDWSKIALFLNHIRYVWCASDLEFRYVMKWFAHIIQFPHKKTGTLLAIVGREGDGKTFVSFSTDFV